MVPRLETVTSYGGYIVCYTWKYTAALDFTDTFDGGYVIQKDGDYIKTTVAQIKIYTVDTRID